MIIIIFTAIATSTMIMMIVFRTSLNYSKNVRQIEMYILIKTTVRSVHGGMLIMIFLSFAKYKSTWWAGAGDPTWSLGHTGRSELVEGIFYL